LFRDFNQIRLALKAKGMKPGVKTFLLGTVNKLRKRETGKSADYADFHRLKRLKSV
jgi:hypothetical protein